MPIRYDRGIGANVYDPSGMNEASQGNAMAALARALGYTNEASGLGLAAAFGGPQMAAQGLQDLVQTEQQNRQLQNQRDLMAMQMAGQSAIQQARLEQAAQQAAAQRDLSMWGKQGDWQRYDKQMQTQKDVAQSNKIADFMKAYYGEQGKAQRAAEANKTTLTAAQMRADAQRQAAESKTPKFYTPPNDVMLASIANLKRGWNENPANKGKPMPPDSSFAAAAFKDYNAKLGIDVNKIGGPNGSLSPEVQQALNQGKSPVQPENSTSAPTQTNQEPTAWQRSMSQFSQNLPNAKTKLATLFWLANPMGAGLENWKKASDVFGPAMFPTEYPSVYPQE